MAGEVDVTGRPGENVHNVIHRCGQACPPLGPGAGVVSPGDGAGDVGLRRHPMEVRSPLSVGRQAPEGGQDAIDRGVLPVAFHQGELPCDVVDEGDPEGAQAPGEGDQGEDLGDYLQDVDEGLPGGKGGEVLRLDDAVVVEDVAVEEQDVTTTILPPGRFWHGFSGRQVSRLLPEVPVQEERVGVEHREGASDPPRPGDQAWPMRRHQSQSDREGVVGVGCRVGRPGVQRLDGRPPGRSEGGLGEERQTASQARCLIRREAVSSQCVVDLPKDLLRPLGRGRKLYALRADRQLYPLNHMAFGWGLRLGGLRLEPEEGEEVGDRVVSGVGEVGRVHAVEVVDEVAQQHQEKGSQEHLHGVRCAVKVPHARRGAEAHGEVEPERHARSRGEKGATMPGVAHRPLAIGVQEVVGGDVRRPMVALWPDRRQSSPRRSFSSPFSSTWQMAKERAAKQSRRRLAKDPHVCHGREGDGRH